VNNIGLPPDKVIREKLIEEIKQWASHSKVTRNPYMPDTISLHEFRVGSPQPYESRYAHLPAASIDGTFYHVEAKLSVQKTYPEEEDNRQFLNDVQKYGVERALNRGKGQGNLETWAASFYLYNDSHGDWRCHPHEEKLLATAKSQATAKSPASAGALALLGIIGAGLGLAYTAYRNATSGKPKQGADE
jgi:hypothetical protein